MVVFATSWVESSTLKPKTFSKMPMKSTITVSTILQNELLGPYQECGRHPVCPTLQFHVTSKDCPQAVPKLSSQAATKSRVGTPTKRKKTRQTHQALYQGLQSLFSRSLAIFLIIVKFIPHFLVGKFVNDFDDVNDDVCVLVAQKTYELGDCSWADKFGVGDYGSLS